MNGKRVMVTGGGGYVGSVLVEALLDAGYGVTVIDRFFFGVETLSRVEGVEGLALIRKDIRSVTPDDCAGHWAVVDLAALSNEPSGALDPGLTREINHQGRVSVARAAREAGVGRYVLASSCAVYGAGVGDGSILDEGSATSPQTEYARCNLACEGDILRMTDQGFCPTALRFGTVFGLSPRMRFDHVVNRMTLDAVKDGEIIILGGGRQWRPIVHVSDACRGVLLVLTAKAGDVDGQVFNIGADNRQMISVAYEVRDIMPFQVRIDVAQDDVARRDYRVSFDKARRVLDFSARIGIEDGIREIYYALKSGDVEASPKTSTVFWYKTIIEAKRIVDEVMLDGRLI